MPVREFPADGRFQVALSFAGEQRVFVREIAETLERRLGKTSVFYDEWYQSWTAGGDSDLKLQRLYGEQCELVVVCVSRVYEEKPWTRIEHAAIRDREMRARTSRDPGAEHCVFPLRVGDGDLGIHLGNTIVPDVQAIPPLDVVEMIVERLRLVRGETAVGAPHPAVSSWPATPQVFDHGLADRTAEHEWPAVLRLLTSGATKRVLMYRAPSNHSKSALLGAAAEYARSVLRIPVVHLDFKDSALLNEQAVIQSIQGDLRSFAPGFARSTFSRWTLRQALGELPGAVLFVFDTFEKVAATKDLAEWIEGQVLSQAVGNDRLRFLLAGQGVPDPRGTSWEKVAQRAELGPIRDLAPWREWIRSRPDGAKVDDKHVEALVLVSDGVPGNVSGALETLAQRFSRQT